LYFEDELQIDEKRMEDIVRLGYRSAKRNLDEFEEKYSCTFLDLTLDAKMELPPGELEEWRISFMAVRALRDKAN
jgi:hypothetical protein